MNAHTLEPIIDQAWEQRASITPETHGEIAEAIWKTLHLLDDGALRVATHGDDGDWHVHQWIKKAVLLWFRLSPNVVIAGGPNDPRCGESVWYDKVRPKFAGWAAEDFKRAGFRAVPGAVVRYSAFIAPDVVLMPSFVNVGAHVGAGTMVDTWATVGSCAQIGRNVHLSGGVGIGGCAGAAAGRSGGDRG